MTPKKILHIQLLPLLSGVQNVMLTLLDGLDREEFEIHVACRPHGPLVEALKQRGISYLPLPLFVRELSGLDIPVFFRLWHLCRKHKFDIVHTHSSKPGFLGRIAARLARVPLIIHTGHGAPFYDLQPLRVQKFYMRLELFAGLFCDRMVFVNNYHRNFYLRHKLLKASKALTIYNALNPSLQERLVQLPLKEKKRGETVIIGSVLRFTRAKNIVMTIIAAIRVCHARRDVKFIFAGDGELYELCSKMIKTNRLQERILLPGWQDDAEACLKEFDVYLLYSDYEGQPLGIIEAMYAGIPVASSNLPVLAELVNKSNGWLIPRGQLDRLEAELHKIIDDPESYYEKGKAGRKKAEELCSHEKFLAGYLSLYRGEKP